MTKSSNAGFRVSRKDIIEFNQWIKSKDVIPSFRSSFRTDSEYEDYMINYLKSHKDKVFSGVSEGAAVINSGMNYGKEHEDFSDREKVPAELLEKAKNDGVVQQKPNGSWGIISIDAGEWWDADYDSKESAEDALKAYHANKSFSGRVSLFSIKPMSLNYLANRCSTLRTEIKDLDSDIKNNCYKGKDLMKSSNKLGRMKIELKHLSALKEELENYDNDTYESQLSQKHFSLIPLKNGSFDPMPTEMLLDNIPGVPDLIGSLMFSVTYAHLYHICTAEYPAHIALQEYYEAMPDLVDALAEAAIGNNDTLEFRCIAYPKESESAVDYFNSLLGLVLKVQEITGQADQLYQPQIDAIKEQVESTLYKLKRLSSGQKVFSEVKSFSVTSADKVVVIYTSNNEDYYSFSSQVEEGSNTEETVKGIMRFLNKNYINRPPKYYEKSHKFFRKGTAENIISRWIDDEITRFEMYPTN